MVDLVVTVNYKIFLLKPLFCDPVTKILSNICHLNIHSYMSVRFGNISLGKGDHTV
jgi:carotenoid cleavage dioxygenase-like enzyme